MNPQHMRNPIPRSTEGAGGGGGGDTLGGGGGNDSVGGGGGNDTLGGGDDAPWYAGLPDDLKTQAGVTRHATLTDAINAGVAAEKRLGVPADQLLRLPKDDKDAEGLKAIYKALGAPDSPDGYKIEWKDATDADKAMIGDFAKFMHEKGPFPPAALAAAAEFWAGQVASAQTADLEAAKLATEAGTAALKTEWGAAFDQTSAAVGKLIADVGGEDLAKELNASNLGDSPALAKFLAKITERLVESPPSGDGQHADVGARPLTPGQAHAALAAFHNDAPKMTALMDKTNSAHQAAVDERNRLLLLANPKPQQAA